MRNAKWIAMVTCGLALTSCSVAQKNEEQAASSANEETAGVTRQEATPSPTPTPTPTPTQLTTVAIQSQPGPEGRSVDLLRASVAGDVLSVVLSYRAGPGNRSNGRRWHNSSQIKIDEVSAIDDATSQRLGVLKDDRGQWMAAPLASDEPDEVKIEAGDEDVQAWFKFPAPSAGAKTVSINIPGAGSFDAVPVAR